MTGMWQNQWQVMFLKCKLYLKNGFCIGISPLLLPRRDPDISPNIPINPNFCFTTWYLIALTLKIGLCSSSSLCRPSFMLVRDGPGRSDWLRQRPHPRHTPSQCENNLFRKVISNFYQRLSNMELLHESFGPSRWNRRTGSDFESTCN